MNRERGNTMATETTPEPDRPEWRDTDHWPQCHCPTCAEAARQDPGSSFRLPGLSRDGGER